MKKLLALAVGIAIITGTSAFAANNASSYSRQMGQSVQQSNENIQNREAQLEKTREEYIKKQEELQKKNSNKGKANTDIMIRR